MNELLDDVVMNTESVMTKFESVKDQTTEDYFCGNRFSIDAFNKKYAAFPGETYVQALKRVCDFIASVEKTEKLRKYWSERWFDEIYNDWWHPAGSIMQGAGSKRKVSLANCTTLSLGAESKEEWDNLESIFRNAGYTLAKCAAYRQGLGLDFSKLRPNKAKVLNSANESTGAVHWMKFLDSIGYYVGQKGRIPAMLFSLSISHPDIEEFITVKSDYTKIQNANISVQCTDNFYKACENNDEWELFFEIPARCKGDKVYVDVHSATLNCEQDSKGYYYVIQHDKPKEIISKKVKARKLLELIAKNMHRNAEPGIQNIDIARKYSNSDYLESDGTYCPSIISTNACSEQYLSRESLCVLSSINCEKFSFDPKEYDRELDKIGHSVNRFLDNVNECELKYHTYATAHQKIAIEKLRRTGAGYTNLAGWLFKLNLEYGTDEANSAVAEFTKTYNYYLYKSSIELGEEKGNFGLFQREHFERSPFVQRMMKLELEFRTMRNVTCSSIAPTGTLSTQFRNCVMSYGIEPGFGLYYWKRTRMAGFYEYYFCVPYIVRKVYENAGYKIPMDSDTVKDTWDGQLGKSVAKFIEENRAKVGINFKEAPKISPFDKLELMSKVMTWVDSSISVTYLLPEDSDWKDVYKFILEAHKKEVKSIAAFPDKKMYGIVSFIPFKELALKLQKEGVALHSQNFTDEELNILGMSKENVLLNPSQCPKRLKTLDADIHIVGVKGQKFIIVVGFQNGAPYEIFGGHLNGLNIKNAKSGKVTKVNRGKYSLEFGDIEIEDFSQQFTPVEKILFRMISTMLRHGVPIEFILDQLQKSTDDITSLASAVGRVLKKYIKDGQRVYGQECPSCKSTELVYQDGCVSCKCGWSKCS